MIQSRLQSSFALVAVCVFFLATTGCAIRKMNTTLALPNGDQIVWGTPVNGLIVGLESRDVKDARPQFFGHLKNTGSMPISIIDPRSTEQRWGVVVSLLEETGSTTAVAPPLPPTLTLTLAPGESIKIPLTFRLDQDRVPYETNLRYTYGNQIPKEMPGLGTPAAPLWTGQAQSGEIKVRAKYIEVEVYKPTQRFG